MSATLSYAVRHETHSFPNHQDIRLDADVYWPDAPGEFPVLVMRQPYGRAIASTVVYAHPRWYAAQGYIVVIQDVQGCGTSGGNFDPFGPQEIQDGYDTVQWAAHLPGSNGQVGMYGFSYQGMTQLYAAQTQPPALKALCPAMSVADLYRGWFYEGGAFRLQANLSWAIQLAALNAQRHHDDMAYQVLRQALTYPAWEQMPATMAETLHKYAPFYFEWFAHNTIDEYWRSRHPKIAEIDLPMFHVGGWFDPYLRGTLDLFQKMRSQAKAPQLLMVGPWGHLPWGQQLGDRNYGPAAQNPIDYLQIRWFDHWLKDIDTGLLDNEPVNVFSIGNHQWQAYPDWPPVPRQVYYFHSNGLASTRTDAGTITPIPPSQFDTIPDVLVHDPWRPVPSCGGHSTWPAGQKARSHLDDRADVLTYTTEPASEPLQLCGEVLVSVQVQCSHPSFDLCAVLSQVEPDGTVMTLTQGYGRFRPSTELVHVTLQAICAEIPAGAQLRVSLSAASFPAFPVNPGEEEGTAAQVITLRIRSDAQAPSAVRLPLVLPEVEAI